MRYFLQRLLLIPILVIIVHFAGFAYANLSLQIQKAQNPFGSASVDDKPQIFSLYGDYASLVFQGDFGSMPTKDHTPLLQAVTLALFRSLGLLGLAFILSTLFGFFIGMAAVRSEPPGIAGWLPALASIGMAVPSFFVGGLLVVLFLAVALKSGPYNPPLIPLVGFGWDAHLILPVLALSIRPAAQVAQATAGLLVAEMDKQYIVTARAVGHSWRVVQWKHAFRNILAPVILNVASSLRTSLGELILVEWLFAWPGLGRLLAQALVPPRLASTSGLQDVQAIFLNPPLVGALLAVFTLLFLIIDTTATLSARRVDPRLQSLEVPNE